jgi:hypothetical protein
VLHGLLGGQKAMVGFAQGCRSAPEQHGILRQSHDVGDAAQLPRVNALKVQRR